MLKTLLALVGTVLLAVPALHAQGVRGRVMAAHPTLATHVSPLAARSYPLGYRHRGYHHGYRGRYYYYGGVPYFYPFYGYGYGYGYPYYGGFYGDFGYNGAYPGYGYNGYNGNHEGQNNGDNPRDGDDTQRNSGASLPEAVQRQLAKRGYYKGTIDGQFGPQSSSALSRFQRKQGLKETGRIDEPTLEALGFTDHR